MNMNKCMNELKGTRALPVETTTAKHTKYNKSIERIIKQ